MLQKYRCEIILAVQDYLRGGGNLSDLEKQYAIKVKHYPELGVVGLNYNQISSPMHETVVQECRGLILEHGTWNVVSRGFKKFFNYGQPEAAEIDWATARIQEKLDGSYVSFWYYEGVWNISTKGVADASGPVGSGSLTFRDLVLLALKDMGYPRLGDFTALLDPGLFYSFELTTPENRVIIPYETRTLTYIAAWNAKTLEEAPDGWLADRERTVKEYPVQTLEELLQAAQDMPPYSGEGFVVVDGDYNRIKIKSPSYLLADRVITNTASPRRKVDFVRQPDFDDYIPQLPSFVRDDLISVRDAISNLRREVVGKYAELSGIAERRDFAIEASQSNYSGMLFKMRDGKTVDEVIANCTSDKLAELVGLK